MMEPFKMPDMPVSDDDVESKVLQGLKVEDAVRFKRALSPNGIFEDAFELFKSVIEQGEAFPIRWEARLMELGILTFPDRDALRNRLDTVRATRRLRIFDQLSDGEVGLAVALIGGTASVGQGLSLYASMAAKDISFPLYWEEKHLRTCLKAEPDRIDLLSRYRTVLILLGRQIPQEIELRVAEAAKREEFEADHQLAAKQYHIKTELDDVEAEFRAMAEHIRPYTMTSMERLYALFKAVQYVVDADVPGAFLECGVWRGGSMMLVARVLMSLDCLDRDLYLFDTFEGLPRPDTEVDIDIWGNRAIDGWLPKQVNDTSSHWAEAGLEEVKANIALTGYPTDRVHFIKGMVETTVPAQAPDEIALLRLDTDWYASTKHEMEHLYPRLQRSGVLIIDDYGHFKGARKAIDDYLQDNRVRLLLNRIDYSGRMAIKTE